MLLSKLADIVAGARLIEHNDRANEEASVLDYIQQASEDALLTADVQAGHQIRATCYKLASMQVV